MLITKQFVFVHIPKTGGEFLRQACARHLPGDWIVSTDIAKHGVDTEIPTEYRHLPRFSLVRNPWDWHVSWYHYLIGSGRPEAHRERVRRANPCFAALSDDFAGDFAGTMRRLYTPRPAMDLLTLHLRNQVGASLSAGEITMGRFETLREDFLSFLADAGVPVSEEFRADLLERPAVNRSHRDRYPAYYDDDTRDLIARLSADTSARYGYSFDDPSDGAADPAPPAREAVSLGAAALREESPAATTLPSPVAGTESAPPPLLILGGHRSGTSLVAGLLWHAGLHLGTLLGAGPDNPRGFFESVDVLAAHEAILFGQDRDWTCPPHRFDPRTADLTLLRRAAAGLAGGGGSWGVKDPRLLFLLPAWVEAVPAMRFIGVVRHPAAVARSLEKRNGLAPAAARAIADFYLARLAALHRALSFPLLGFDGPSEEILARTRALVEVLGLSWDEAAAASLFDPALRHQKAEGAGGADYDALMNALADGVEAPRVISSAEVAAALASLPDPESAALPPTLGPWFLERRARLWEAFTPSLPPVGRVLDLIPEGAAREPLLAGVDPAEIDLAEFTVAGEWRGGDPAVRYTHALLTGVAETLPFARLEDLFSRLADSTTSDAAAVLDALLVDGLRSPRRKHWGRLAAGSARTGPLHHHHLDEIELAALEADWLVGDVEFNPEGRSRLLLVKQAHRRAPGWMTSSERRQQQQAAERARSQLEREREHHRTAYDALLEENAAIRQKHYAALEEVRRLRRLRKVRGWLGFQARRLRPSRLARGLRRRGRPRRG